MHTVCLSCGKMLVHLPFQLFVLLPTLSPCLAGLMDISNQLKDLLPILVSCFRDFMPMVHGNAQLDLQSCDCMQFILQSIDIIARFCVDGICGSEHDPHIIVNQLISPMSLKKLWDVYPLTMVHHSSGKVYCSFI